jgi:hypothetical protein
VDGHILAHANRHSPASEQYHALVENLGLATMSQANARARKGEALPLVLEALRDGLDSHAKRAESQAPVVLTPRAPETPTREPAPHFPRSSEPTPIPSRASEKTPESLPLEPQKPEPAKKSNPRQRRPARLASTRPPVTAPPPELPPAIPEPEERLPPPRHAQPEPEPAFEQPAPVPAPAPPTVAGLPLPQAALWFGVAIFVGVGLRFLHIPQNFLPMLVGLAVGGAVIIFALRGSLFDQGTQPAQPTPTKPTRNGHPGRSLAARVEEVRRPRTGNKPGSRPGLRPLPPRSDLHGN